MPTALYQSLQDAGLTASQHDKRAVHMHAEIYVRCSGPFGAWLRGAR